MARTIVPELCKSNPYYISKHRYYELKHFCLQYPEWKREIKELRANSIRTGSLIFRTGETSHVDMVSENAIRIFSLGEKMQKVDLAIKQLDDWIQPYIFAAVTEGYSFTYLKTVMNIPCERDTYYDRYRRFFYILSV